MAERVGFEPTKHRASIGFVRQLVTVLISMTLLFRICLKAPTISILAYISVDLMLACRTHSFNKSFDTPSLI
jgi:hypothetical protein